MRFVLAPVKDVEGELCRPMPRMPDNDPHAATMEMVQRCTTPMHEPTPTQDITDRHPPLRPGFKRYYFMWSPMQASDRAEWPFTYQWEVLAEGRRVAFGSQGQTRTPPLPLKPGRLVKLTVRVKDRTGQEVGRYDWNARPPLPRAPSAAPTPVTAPAPRLPPRPGRPSPPSSALAELKRLQASRQRVVTLM